MKKRLLFCVMSLCAVTTVFGMISPAFATKRTEPVPLYGSYTRDLDRSKQTFNGKVNPNTRPWKQTEDFSTVCDASGCVAHTPNLYAPPGAPKFIDYNWKNDHWELQAAHFFNCNDGSKVNSFLYDVIKPNGDGSFSGERSIKIESPGCPGEGPGIYRIPFKLTPT